MNKKNRKFFIKIMSPVLVILILAVGVIGAKKLISSKKAPVRKEMTVLAPLLIVEVAKTESISITVEGYGTVKPKAEVKVIPQVSGRVVACHPDFVNGGFFKKDEALITIESADYKLAVESSQAAVTRDQVRLEKEQAEAEVAKQEWAQLNPDKAPTSSLVLREPQIKDATAQLLASKAMLETAKLNLDRTVISMPFDGRIAEESVDIGQYLTPGQVIATVYSTESVEIVVPLEDRQLAWFDVPTGHLNSNGEKNKGSDVKVVADFAGKKHVWQGRLVRMEGTIDPTSRMVNVVVEVKDPFKAKGDRVPLVPGMFVEIVISGKILENVILVPRYAIRNGNQVWVANSETLHIKEVQIARSDNEYAYIISGLADGETVITSSLDTVTDGMKIRIQKTGEAE